MDYEREYDLDAFSGQKVTCVFTLNDGNIELCGVYLGGAELDLDLIAIRNETTKPSELVRSFEWVPLGDYMQKKLDADYDEIMDDLCNSYDDEDR